MFAVANLQPVADPPVASFLGSFAEGDPRPLVFVVEGRELQRGLRVTEVRTDSFSVLASRCRA